MTSKRDAWLVGVRLAFERNDSLIGALAMGDRLASEFETRFPDPPPPDPKVRGAVDDARHAFAGMIPPELLGAVMDRLEAVAQQTIERGEGDDDY